MGQDVRVLDVRGISTITEFCVIASGTSSPHLKALLSEVQRCMKERGVMSYRKSGLPESGWVVLDFVHAVIHIFSPEARTYYAIERLWQEAPALPLPPAS
jgi:ribosome-associated protein